MAVVTNTYTTYDTKGIRESLSDVIYNISPETTPFVQTAKRGKADAVFYEWQVDSLADADTTNAKVEGNEAAYVAATATTRVGNYVQISDKTAIISGTNDVVKKAGRKSEMAYQLAKRGAELKRDIEAIAVSNQACVSGGTATARKTGTMGAYLATNVSKASDGTNPTGTTTPNDARGDGTTRQWSETILKEVILAAYNSGGEPRVLMLPPALKQLTSTFAGIAGTRFNVNGAKAATIIGAADIYVSDFGNISVVPNRFMRASDAFVLDPDYIEIVYLRPFTTESLAKTGDAEKRLILAEWGLKVPTEKAHGLAADLKATA
ncbi:MAG: DUF5309 domain-containing protein [Armatimonadia bacterium]